MTAGDFSGAHSATPAGPTTGTCHIHLRKTRCTHVPGYIGNLTSFSDQSRCVARLARLLPNWVQGFTPKERDTNPVLPNGIGERRSLRIPSDSAPRSIQSTCGPGLPTSICDLQMHCLCISARDQPQRMRANSPYNRNGHHIRAPSFNLFFQTGLA